jgi:hypothetical protein
MTDAQFEILCEIIPVSLFWIAMAIAFEFLKVTFPKVLDLFERACFGNQKEE